jgi:hypothetical protein
MKAQNKKSHNRREDLESKDISQKRMKSLYPISNKKNRKTLVQKTNNKSLIDSI